MCLHFGYMQELRAHQCVLAACSEYFKRLFCGPETAKRIEFQQRWPVVHQLVRCMYGADIEAGTDPEIVLEVLKNTISTGTKKTRQLKHYKNIVCSSNYAKACFS